MSGHLRQVIATVPNQWKPVAAMEPVRLQLPEAAARVVQRFAHLQPKAPAAYELEHIYRELLDAWQRDRWEQLSRRTLRRSPYALFWTGGPLLLAGEEEFLRGYFRVMRARSLRGPTARALLHVYLREYPTHLTTFPQLRASIERFLFDTPSILLDHWRNTARQYDLFTDEGPRNVALAWWRKATPLLLMATSGFTGELASGNFMRHVFAEICRLMYRCLAMKEATEHDLLWFYDFCTTSDRLPRRPLRFAGANQLFADALLLPFKERMPGPSIQRQITRMLINTLGDPRIVPWTGVRDSTVAIFRRWLIGNALEDFFQLIDRTADPEHWRYRRQFWLAYHKRGHIDDACIALGRQAWNLARSRSLSLELESYSKLDQARHDQSILLLRIGRLTILEWSHSGACRIWVDPEDAPRLHQRRYTRPEVMKDATETVSHFQSGRYRWQQELATKIHYYTGIHIPWSDFQVDGSS